MSRPFVDLTNVGHDHDTAIIDALLMGDAVTPDEAWFSGVHLDLLRSCPDAPVLVELIVLAELDVAAAAEWLALEWQVTL